MNASFVHLKAHSEYSIRDGLLRIKPWLNAVVDMQMPAVAITDFHNLFALVKFYRQALSVGVKPIIGADVDVIVDDEVYRLTLLCQNKTGYQQLTALLSKAYLQGQTHAGEPRIQWSWLQDSVDGLIALSGAGFGDIGQALLQGKQRLAEQRLQGWRDLFADRFYIELQRTGREHEEDYIHQVMALAQAQQVPVVATNDVRFLTADDFEAHEARVCIHSGYVLNDAKRPRPYSEQQYFRSADDMAELFSDIPEALANSVAIAQRCNVQLTLGESFLPKFPVPNDQPLETYLEQQSLLGLKQRQDGKTIAIPADEYQQRLQTELSVINRMGFAGYFLIVADFIQWAKQQKIPVGPGRGSGAGSLVAYCLGITELDPLEHELLFERFLNPERVSMPDFDIDFCMERRDLVIEYVANRYGREAVSQIITYGTMAAKAVVRDVGRVLAMPYGFVDKIAKLIPFELGITLDKALASEELLAERYHQEDEVSTLIDLAKKLEGVTRNAGKHAGGVVIAPTKLIDFAPLYCEPGGDNVVTQFDKDDVEAVGLVKFDFLGLRTLTIIDWAIKAINQKRESAGESLLDIGDIPLDDEKTFKLLKNCETTAVFQLESRGMKDLVKRLQPDEFEEITALVALFRPGPLQSGMVDDFIARKHGRAVVHYAHPELEPILRPTHGVILYQEQVMQIAQNLAGYSLGGADLLRRAMGKKKPEEMAKQRRVFVSGASARGIEESLAEYIFDLMEKFAGYGFNKSHSAAYALIAYQTAWLKAHYPAEFMAAVLSSDMDNTDKVVGFYQECKRINVKVLPPNVNSGAYQFVVNQQGAIEYGLGAVKGAGQAAIEHIVAEREQAGPFSNLFDFCQRLDSRKVSRRVIEPLVRSGAMDCFDCSRASLFASINRALKAAEQSQRDAAAGQADLFADTTVAAFADYVDAKEWTEQQRLQGEKETIGLYLSGHPLDSFQQELDALTTYTLSQLSRLVGKTVKVGGMIEALRVIQTRKGTRMAVISLADRSGELEVTVFSKLFDEVRSLLQKDQLVIVGGSVAEDKYTGGVRLVAESIDPLMQVREQRARCLRLKVKNQQQVEYVLSKLQQLLTPYLGGQCDFVISYTTPDSQMADIALGERWRVKPNVALFAELEECCGSANITVDY